MDISIRPANRTDYNAIADIFDHPAVVENSSQFPYLGYERVTQIFDELGENLILLVLPKKPLKALCMAIEIERKFLVDIDKIGALGEGQVIKQGYIQTKDKTVVRARIMGSSAFLTLKGENTERGRLEFEYPIPVADADEIIKKLCSGPTIDKTRYLIEHKGHTWELDVFEGENKGLVIAEVELEEENEVVEIPPWVTREVTGNSKYYNSNLLVHPYGVWAEDEKDIDTLQPQK